MAQHSLSRTELLIGEEALNKLRQELSNKEEFIKRVKKVVKLKVQLNRLYLFMIKLTNLQFF